MVIIEEDGNLRLGPEAKPVTVDRLKSELLAEIGKNPQLKLTLNADKKAPFGQIVKVMDAAKEAKIKTISAFTGNPANPDFLRLRSSRFHLAELVANHRPGHSLPRKSPNPRDTPPG